MKNNLKLAQVNDIIEGRDCPLSKYENTLFLVISVESYNNEHANFKILRLSDNTEHKIMLGYSWSNWRLVKHKSHTCCEVCLINKTLTSKI